MIERLKRLARRELAFFRDAPLLSLMPEREISVLVGAGTHLYVQAQYDHQRPKKEQDAEIAHTLLAAAQMMAVSSGLMQVQFGSPAAPPPIPPEGVPNG